MTDNPQKYCGAPKSHGPCSGRLKRFDDGYICFKCDKFHFMEVTPMAFDKTKPDPRGAYPLSHVSKTDHLVWRYRDTIRDLLSKGETVEVIHKLISAVSKGHRSNVKSIEFSLKRLKSGLLKEAIG